MNGKDAKNYIIDELPLTDPELGSKMILGRHLAHNLMKCSSNDIGTLATKYCQGGLKAIEGEMLWGYVIAFSRDQPHDKVSFVGPTAEQAAE